MTRSAMSTLRNYTRMYALLHCSTEFTRGLVSKIAGRFNIHHFNREIRSGLGVEND